MPESLQILGSYAFRNCKSLEWIEIPKGVTIIEFGAFGGCVSLHTISVSPENPIYDSRNKCNAIVDTQTNRLICGCWSTIIPDTVVEISYDAFYGCSLLRFIDIPESVARIGDYAFWGCSQLKSINLLRAKQVEGIVMICWKVEEDHINYIQNCQKYSKDIILTGYVSDDELAEGLLQLADAGASLCDVMGDMFCKDSDELTMDETAVKKQLELLSLLVRMLTTMFFRNLPETENWFCRLTIPKLL